MSWCTCAGGNYGCKSCPRVLGVNLDGIVCNAAESSGFGKNCVGICGP